MRRTINLATVWTGPLFAARGQAVQLRQGDVAVELAGLPGLPELEVGNLGLLDDRPLGQAQSVHAVGDHIARELVLHEMAVTFRP